MDLNAETNTIKYYAKNIVSNFIKIGGILKKIRDSGNYKEKFTSFKDYLIDSKFPFCRETAYKMIKLVEDERLVAVAQQLGLSKTMELIYVTPQDIKEELIEEIQKGDLTTDDEVREAKDKKILSRLGEESKYASRLPSEERKTDYDLKCNRDFLFLKERWDLVEIRIKNLTEATDKFVKEMNVHKRNDLSDKAKKLIRTLN